MDRITRFKELELGLFVHFGIYSQVGLDEWYKHDKNIPNEEYDKLLAEFKVNKNWAKGIIKVAKSLGAKYIVLTTRHHDGFSLYDTHGLTNYDISNTPTRRDLVKEFVEECNKNDILPFFYHTLIDWHHPYFNNNFDKYREYLFESVELLCTNYGKVGGFWFDGSWHDKKLDFKLDELFALIRKYQPEAIICNNGGLENTGEIISDEIDVGVFERGNPSKDIKGKAKEMCQTLNDHWGYYKSDKNYKSLDTLLSMYKKCRDNDSNLLLNIGPKGNGTVRIKEKVVLKRLGKQIKNLQA